MLFIRNIVQADNAISTLSYMGLKLDEGSFQRLKLLTLNLFIFRLKQDREVLEVDPKRKLKLSHNQ